MTATRADVERAVSGRPGRGPRNGRVLGRRQVRARSRRWFKACVPDDEIPGLGGQPVSPPRYGETGRAAGVECLGPYGVVLHAHHLNFSAIPFSLG